MNLPSRKEHRYQAGWTDGRTDGIHSHPLADRAGQEAVAAIVALAAAAALSMTQFRRRS